MRRNSIWLVLAVISVIFLPLFVQVIVLVLGVFFARHAFVMLIPALWADLWYAPQSSFGLSTWVYTLIVLGVNSIRYIFARYTRIGERYYGMEKK